MKKILVMIMLVFVFGCSDDATEPSEDSIVGKYKRFYQEIGEQENVLLVVEFTNNGEVFYKIEEGSNSGNILEGIYTLEGSILTLIDEDCKDEVGKYELQFKENGIELTRIEDECDRGNYMPGFFYNYDEVIDNPLS